MFGFDDIGLISFIRQIGLAVSGAACLWGIFFTVKADATGESKVSGVIYTWVSRKILALFFIGVILAVIGWLGSLEIIQVYAHEGIRLVPTIAQITNAFLVTTPVYLSWISVLAVVVFIRPLWKYTSTDHLGKFYFLNLLVIIFLISFYAVGDANLNDLSFFAFHGFHSIMTVGTVLTLDFLYVISRKSNILKEHIFPHFPSVSKVIWVGLGLDFLSVFLIYPDAVVLDSRFFFVQTVIGILIINGVLLSGHLTRKVVASVQTKKPILNHKLQTLMNIAGTVSVTSWFTITFLDFFDNISLSYLQLLFSYVSIILILFTAHHIFEKFDRELKITHIRKSVI